MKEIYDRAINPNTEFNNIDGLSIDEIQQIKFDINSSAVNQLISFK